MVAGVAVDGQLLKAFVAEIQLAAVSRRRKPAVLSQKTVGLRLRLVESWARDFESQCATRLGR